MSTPLSMSDIRKLARELSPQTDQSLFDSAKQTVGEIGAHLRQSVPDVRDAYRVKLAQLRAG